MEPKDDIEVPTAVEAEDLFEVLNHETRRNIIELLRDNIEMTYSEFLDTLAISDGLLNFHLRKMKKFVKTTKSGSYILSDYGKVANIIIRNAQTDLKTLGKLSRQEVRPTITKDVVGRRVLAFILDVVIFFIFTGIFLDPLLYTILFEFGWHASALFGLHPWIFHLEHLPMIGELAFRTLSVYAHVFFAVLIFITLLEGYRGQTLGKYIVGIRVVKVGGRKIGLLESGIRNAGKVFLLPLDMIIGLFYLKKGYLRFFDYFTNTTVEKVTKKRM